MPEWREVDFEEWVEIAYLLAARDMVALSAVIDFKE